MNRPGVLNRITNLFTKRNYNIESISVGPTEHEGVSRMTCVVHVEDDRMAEQITKQLNKQIDVLKVAVHNAAYLTLDFGHRHTFGHDEVDGCNLGPVDRGAYLG